MNVYEIFVKKFWEKREIIFQELEKIYFIKTSNAKIKIEQFIKNYNMIKKRIPDYFVDNNIKIVIRINNVALKFNYNKKDILFPIHFLDKIFIKEVYEPIFSIDYLFYIIKNIYKFKNPYGLTDNYKEYQIDKSKFYKLSKVQNYIYIFDNDNEIKYQKLINTIYKDINEEILNSIYYYFGNLNCIQ